MNNDIMNLNPDGEEMEMKLWEFIDGFASEKESPAIEKLIAENAAWKAKYQELVEVHQLIKSSELDHPSLRFTKNVMEEIARYHIAPATRNYINSKVVWGIALFFIIMIAGFLIYGISQINWADASNSKSSLGIDFSKVDYTKMFSNTLVNIFMMLNVVLGLMLLDRYLSNKKKKITGQAH